jgi:hypothetical protein
VPDQGLGDSFGQRTMATTVIAVVARSTRQRASAMHADAGPGDSG